MQDADRTMGFADTDALRTTADELVPLLYADLRRIARHARWRVSGGATLQTTALVHEAYLKLREGARFNDSQHFLRAAALAMRHVLVNVARESDAAKRGGGSPHVSLDEALHVVIDDAGVFLEVDAALQRLETLSPRLARVVECRFYAGYSDQETAEALGLTERTVRRDWVKARALLRYELAGDGP